MKVVQIPNYGPVSFDDNVPDQEIQARATRISEAIQQRQQQGQQQKDAEYSEYLKGQGLGALASGGFHRALTGLGSTITDTLPALAGSALGFNDYARQQLEEAKAKREKTELAYPTAFKSYKDVDSLGHGAGFVAETLGELGPDILGMLTGAGVGATVGKRVAAKGAEKLAEAAAAEALKKGGERGALAGMYGSSVGLNAPDTFESVYEKTGKLEPGIALAFGAAQGVLDTYLPGKILAQLGGAGKERLAAELVKRSTIVPPNVKLGILKELGKTTAGEAGTESLQEVLGILAEKTAGDKTAFNDPANIDRLLNAAIKGGIGGGAFGAPGAVVEARRENKLAKDEIANREEAARVKAEQEAQAAQIKAEQGAQAARVQATPPGQQIDMFPQERQVAEQATQGPPAPSPSAPGVLSFDAQTLLAQAAQGNLPPTVNFELRDIAEKNGISVEPSDTPASIVQKLQEKTAARPQAPSPGQGTLDLEPNDLFPNERAAALKAVEGIHGAMPPVSPIPARPEAPAKAPEQRSLDFVSDEELKAELERRAKQNKPKGHAAGERRLEKVLGTAEYDMFGEPIPTERRTPVEAEAPAVEEAPTRDVRQGELQFAPPAPEGPFNKQLPTDLAAQQRQRQEDAAYAERERKAQEELKRKEEETNKLANRAAAARQAAAVTQEEELVPQEEVRQEHVQPSLPGLAKTYGEKVAQRGMQEEEPLPEPTPTVTDELLTNLGVLKVAPLRKRLVGKNMEDAAEREVVQQELSTYAQNEAVPERTRKRIKKYITSPVFYKQTELFGPKGGPTAEAPRKAKKPEETKPEETKPEETKPEETKPEETKNEPEPAATTVPPAGESVSVSSGPKRKRTAKGTGTPADGGVDVSASGAGQADVREGEQPAAVKPETAQDQEPTTKAKTKKEAKPKAEAPAEEIKKEAPAEAKKDELTKEESEEALAPGTLRQIKRSQSMARRLVQLAMFQGYTGEEITKKDVTFALALGKGTITPRTNASKKAQIYFGKMSRAIDALRNIAFDIAFDTPQHKAEPTETAEETAFFKGMNGENAALAAEWVGKNLSAETIKRLNDMIAEYRQMASDDATQAFLAALGGADVVETTADETVMDYISARKSAALPAPKGEVIEGEFTQIYDDAVGDQVEDLPSKQKLALEGHYDAQSDSPEFKKKLMDDLQLFASRGAKAIDKAIRNIIKAIYQGVISIAMIFNTSAISPPEKVVTFTPQEAQTRITAPQVTKATVPDEVTGMSDAAKTAYEALIPAMKNKNGDKLILIADKPSGRMFVFTHDGKLVVQKKTLFGLAKGDLYVGNNDLPQNRVTPAGLFGIKLVDAKTSPSAKRTAGEYDFGKVFALNDPDAVVTIMHSVWLHESDAAKRAAALKNEAAEDSRYSFGCINVDKATYKQLLDNYESQMDGAKLFVVPDDQTRTKEFLSGDVAQNKGGGDKLVRESIAPEANTQLAAATKKLQSTAIYQLSKAAHPAVINTLNEGNSVKALKLLAASTDGIVSRAALALSRAGISPNVVVTEGLTDESGKAVPGFYDPATDTVHLDAAMGMNAHVILHEMGHAATAHVLANPSHPVTRQLTQIFNDVKDSLDTAYGATSLDEFVAEAWSNPEFQGQLNSINPKGERITAWQRFASVVRNFIRRLMGQETKGIETALDTTDRLINAILSPSPELRESEKLYAASVNPKSKSAVEWLDGITRSAAKLPGMTPERAASINEFLTNAPSSMFRRTVLGSLPMQALGEVASRLIPGATKINPLINEKAGDENKRNARLEATIRGAEMWAKNAGEAKVKLFDGIVANSTVVQVDPTKPRSEYARDSEKLTEWDAMRADWNAIGEEGRQVYVRMRDLYKDVYDEIKRAIGAKIDSAVEDPEIAKNMRNEIYAKMAERGNIEPYFPLAREGDYFLSYNLQLEGKEPEPVLRAFKTDFERREAIRELKASGTAKDIQPYTSVSEINYKNVPATSFVHSVLKVMDLNKVPTEAREQVLRLFLSTIPESSFAQSFQKRKNTPGFMQDSIKVLRHRGFNLSRQISNMTYASKLQLLQQELVDYVNHMGKGGGKEDNRIAAEYLDELKQRIQFAVNPKTNKVSKMMSSLGFNYLLGGNVSSALVNLTQVPLVVLPYLGGKYGYGDSSKAISDAYKLFMGSGFKRTLTGVSPTERVNVNAMLSMGNYDFSDPKLSKEAKQLETLYKYALDQGQMGRSMLYDTLEANPNNSIMDKVNAATGFAFHHGERMNREVTMIAAYNLELARLNGNKATTEEKALSAKEKEQLAAERAVYTTETTNGGTGAATAPRIAQNAIGKVLFMFKRYGVTMNYMLFKMAKDALKNENPDVRKAAFRQLAGTFGTAAIFSGLQGLPLFGVLAMLYNMFADEDDDDFGTVVRGSTNELYYKGLVNYITGADIASRTGLSDLLFRENKMSSGSASMAEFIAETIGGPAYGIATKLERGMKILSDGNTERGIEVMLPSAIGNAMRGIRFATEGANTLRGDPIVGDISAANVFAQMFGFSPAEYNKQLEINARIKGIDKFVNERATKLRHLYNVGLHVGDMEGVEDAREELQKLYAKHPGLGNLQESLAKSTATFNRNTNLLYHGISISPKLRNEMLELAADLED